MRKILKGFGITLVLLILFIYLVIQNLPEASVRNYIEHTINEQLIGQVVSIGEFHITITGLELKNVVIYDKWQKYQKIAEIDSISVYATLLSLVSGKIRIEGDIYQGYIRGYINLIFSTVHIGFADVDLRYIPAVKNCLCLASNTTARGTITMNHYNIQETELGIALDSLVFHMPKHSTSFLAIPDTGLKNVKLEIKSLNIANQFRLLLQSVGDATIDLTGSVTLNPKNPAFSFMNVSLNVTPTATYGPKLLKAIPIIQNYMDSSKRLKVVVKGRFPGIEIKKVQ